MIFQYYIKKSASWFSLWVLIFVLGCFPCHRGSTCLETVGLDSRISVDLTQPSQGQGKTVIVTFLCSMMRKRSVNQSWTLSDEKDVGFHEDYMSVVANARYGYV